MGQCRKQDEKEPKGNIESPAEEDEEKRFWTSREMEEAEPYPLPEATEDDSEGPRSEATEDDSEETRKSPSFWAYKPNSINGGNNGRGKKHN